MCLKVDEVDVEGGAVAVVGVGVGVGVGVEMDGLRILRPEGR